MFRFISILWLVLTTATASESKAPRFPIFAGYLTCGADTWFILTVDSSHEVKEARWLKIGHKFGEFKIIAFDAKHETLSVTAPTGESFVLRVKDSASPGGPMSRQAAMEFALAAVARFIDAVRVEYPDRGVTVAPDLALMPDDFRAQFLKVREIVEKNGGIETAFRLADGRWGSTTAPRHDPAMRLPKEIDQILTAEDRIRLRAAWALAHAEADAKSIPPK